MQIAKIPETSYFAKKNPKVTATLNKVADALSILYPTISKQFAVSATKISQDSGMVESQTPNEFSAFQAGAMAAQEIHKVISSVDSKEKSSILFVHTVEPNGIRKFLCMWLGTEEEVKALAELLPLFGFSAALGVDLIKVEAEHILKRETITKEIFGIHP